MAKRLRIVSPKLNRRLRTAWEGFSPTTLAIRSSSRRELLQSAKLSHGAGV